MQALTICQFGSQRVRTDEECP